MDAVILSVTTAAFAHSHRYTILQVDEFCSDQESINRTESVSCHNIYFIFENGKLKTKLIY